MGTSSLKIFTAAILLLLNDFISFLLIPFTHGSCSSVVNTWDGILIQVGPQGERPKEQHGQDRNIILLRTVAMVLTKA